MYAEYRKKKVLSGRETEEILESGPPDIYPPDSFCPLYRICGGCNLQHMAYEDQLRAKVDMACDSLVRLGGLSEYQSRKPVIKASREKGYRNRLSFTAGGTIWDSWAETAMTWFSFRSAPFSLRDSINF